MILRLRDKLEGERIRSTFYVGEPQGTLQNCGELLLYVGEWQLIGAALLLGAKGTQGRLVVEMPDDRQIIEELGTNED